MEELRDKLEPKLEEIGGLIYTISNIGMNKSDYTMFQAWGIRSTLAIEGNPLSHDEVHDILTIQDIPPIIGDYQRQVINMAQGIYLASKIKKVKNAYSIKFLNAVHALLMNGIGDTVPEYAIVGELRKLNVGVGRYQAPHHEDIPVMMEQFCRWIEDGHNNIQLGILQAIAAHVMFACIHPYGDGNGRMSRWVEIMLLMRARVPAPCAHMLSSHYWETQHEYYRMLDSTHGLLLDGHYYNQLGLEGFMAYALTGFHDFLMIQRQVLHANTESH